MNLRDYINSFPKNKRLTIKKELCKKLRIAESTLKSWCNGNRKTSLSFLGALEEATGGAVTRLDQRPDIFYFLNIIPKKQ
jgi:DNA-binding transcriptional regulator YdaS (Cro superfamily)